MTKVTYRTQTGEIITEESHTNHSNGFKPDYKLRAMALGWTLVKVETTNS